jgi:tRNA pseudouridine55 synthase
MNNRKIKKNINGILLLNKSIGLTSNAALQQVKHLLNAKKAGHTGSLDPLATGMLPICFGEATKFSQYLLESDKHYRVQVTLGIKTTTGDAEGQVVATKPVQVTSENLAQVIKQFTGSIQQIPPMFSALKHQGTPLYELARKGIEVERKPRTVEIYRLSYDGLQENQFNLDVECSKGTYVRTLVEDIGEVLGCGAHVSGLHRVSVFPYQQATMYTFAELEQLLKEKGPSALTQLLLPIESSVHVLPIVKLSASLLFYVRMGQPVMVPHLPAQGLVRLVAEDGLFVGVGEILEDGRVAPRRLVAMPSHKAKSNGNSSVSSMT